MNLDKIISGELGFIPIESILIVGDLLHTHSGKCHSDLMVKFLVKFTEKLDKILKEFDCKPFIKLNVKTSEVARKIVHEIVELKKTLDGMETL